VTIILVLGGALTGILSVGFSDVLGLLLSVIKVALNNALNLVVSSGVDLMVGKALSGVLNGILSMVVRKINNVVHGTVDGLNGQFAKLVAEIQGSRLTRLPFFEFHHLKTLMRRRPGLPTDGWTKAR
jgi:hypothetical protein